MQSLRPARSDAPWNGAVSLKEAQAKAIGLQLVQVQPQTEPLKLELTGRTAYDPNSLNKVRPRFDTLVEKVHAELGQLIHEGRPAGRPEQRRPGRGQERLPDQVRPVAARPARAQPRSEAGRHRSGRRSRRSSTIRTPRTRAGSITPPRATSCGSWGCPTPTSIP